MDKVESFIETSEQIKAAKAKVIDTLAGLHVDLCALAALERSLEDQRQKGVVRISGLNHNDPALVEYLEAYAKQVQIPALQIFSAVDDSISLIYQHTSAARNELPALFERSNRINDFTQN